MRTILCLWLLCFQGLSSLAATAPPKQLTVGGPRTLAVGLIAIADARGLFRKNDIALTFIPTGSGKEASGMLFDRKINLAVAYETVIARNYFMGLPQKIYCQLHTSMDASAILTRADRGIKSAKDLRGKTIGVPQMTNAHFILEMTLEMNSVPASQVKLHFSDPSKLERLLIDGKVDAIAVWDPYLSEAKKNMGSFAGDIYYNEFYKSSSLLIGRDQQHGPVEGGTILSFLRALHQAKEFADNNPQVAHRIISEYLRLPESNFESLQSEVLEMSVSNVLLNHLGFQLEWLADHYPARHAPSSSIISNFNLTALRTISPYFVTAKGANQ